MNPWIVATLILLIAFIPSAIVCLCGDPMQRFIGLQMANILSSLTLFVLAQLNDRTFFFDLVLAEALLSFGTGLVYVRFLERWL